MLCYFVTISLLIHGSFSAPLEETNNREGKYLYYNTFLPNGNNLNYYDNFNFNPAEFMKRNSVDELISREIPSYSPMSGNRGGFNSPIYYIALPPQPYIFVPNPSLDYMGAQNQKPNQQADSLLNLPIHFVANGKPSNIYQWGGDYQFPNMVQTTQKPKPKPQDSPIHNLDSKYVFNGKPSDISVLSDSYGSLYGDVLQNFYP